MMTPFLNFRYNLPTFPDPDLWVDRLRILKVRSRRNLVAIPGADLRRLLVERDRALTDSYRLETECGRLRDELLAVEADRAVLTPKLLVS